jgi:hypothetical protein
VKIISVSGVGRSDHDHGMHYSRATRLSNEEKNDLRDLNSSMISHRIAGL